MQYCDLGPVWFGVLGVGAKPPSAQGGCSEACLGCWGTVLSGRLGAAKVDGCMHEWTPLCFCPVPIPCLCITGAVRSVMYGDR
jgi:hypothetical protein